MLKKVLSLVLALCLMIPMMANLAFAEEPVVITIALGSAEVPSETGEGGRDLYWFAKYITDTYPNAKIEWQLNGTHDDHRTKIKMMAESGELPDMFWESFNEMPMIQKMGLLTPIDEAVGPIKDRFITGSQQYVTFDGKVYGMIYKNDAMGFFYNKKLLKQVGYDELPIEWDKFIECVKKLKEADIIPIAHGATDTWSIWAYNLFFFRYGWRDLEGKFMNGEIKWAETEGLMKPLERIYELSEAGAFPDNVTSQGNDYAMNLFLGGEAAMYNVGTWSLPNMIDSKIADDIGFSWGPFFPDGIADQKIALKEFSNAYWFGPNAFKGEEKKKIMIDAIQHYYSEQFTNEIMVEKLGLLPAVTYTGTGEKVSPLFNLMLGYIGDDYSADMQLAVRNEPSFQEPIWNAITSMITRFMTPEETAETMDEWYQTK